MAATFKGDVDTLIRQAERNRPRAGASPQEVEQWYSNFVALLEKNGANGEAARFREEGKLRTDEARATETYGQWDSLQGNLDPFRPRTPEEQAAYDKAIGVVDPDALHYYDVGDKRSIGGAERVDFGDVNSRWQGKDSAYRGLGYDRGALADMRKGADYYGDLMRNGGRDAESEAAYARSVADAEQIRRAQTEAALAAEEARGGGAGARVLAEQAATQAQVGDAYGAGLASNAMAQERRDKAAQRFFGMSKDVGDTLWGVDKAKAENLDAFARSKYNALDQVSQQNAANQFQSDTYNADKETNAANMNWGRANQVGDQNADIWNNAYMGNAGNYAGATGAYMNSLTGADTSRMGQAGVEMQRQQQALNEKKYKLDVKNSPTWWERAAQPLAAVAGGVGKAVGGIK